MKGPYSDDGKSTIVVDALVKETLGIDTYYFPAFTSIG